METVRFYFSFRSPYAWFAFHRIGRALAGLPVAVDYIPCFPPKDFKNDYRANPAKHEYVVADVERFAAAYGLTMGWPEPFDADWLPAHAAYLFAADEGRGREFALAVFAARFTQERDIASGEVLRAVAESSGLAPDGVIAAAGDPALRKRVLQGMAGGGKDGLFGVPFFVYRGEPFWGNDRIEWLVRRIGETTGRPVPDLRSDPLARPCAWLETVP